MSVDRVSLPLLSFYLFHLPTNHCDLMDCRKCKASSNIIHPESEEARPNLGSRSGFQLQPRHLRLQTTQKWKTFFIEALKKYRKRTADSMLLFTTVQALSNEIPQRAVIHHKLQDLQAFARKEDSEMIGIANVSKTENLHCSLLGRILPLRSCLLTCCLYVSAVQMDTLNTIRHRLWYLHLMLGAWRVGRG